MLRRLSLEDDALRNVGRRRSALAVLTMMLLVIAGCASQRHIEAEASSDGGMSTPVHSPRLFLARHTPLQGWVLVDQSVIGPGP